MKFRRFATVLLVVGAGFPTHAEPEWIALTIDAPGAVVVPVSIDGAGPFPFLLDTGSSHSVIGRSLAARLGLAFVARTTVLTSTGAELRPVVRLNQTRIGASQSEGLLASVAPTPQLAAVASGIEGIIGQDFLSAFNYTLDYRRKRLLWNDRASDDRAVRLPLVEQRGRYLVRIAATRQGPPIFLVPDSGSDGLVMFERGGRTRLDLDPTPQSMSVHSVSGARHVRTMRLRHLTVGPLTLRNRPVAVVAREAGDAAEGDGLLPLHLFDRVTFNAGGGYLALTADDR